MMPMTPTDIALFERPFWFLRHGETDANRLDLIVGSTDLPLNATGRAQAAQAAAVASRLGVDAVYSSALNRARDTANAVAAALGLAVTVVPGLAERSWGSFEGRPRGLRRPGVTPSGAETPEQFTERVLAGLRDIPPTGCPLIVAHSGTYRVLVRLLGVDEPVDPVANARPLRFVAPSAPGQIWTVEPLAG